MAERCKASTFLHEPYMVQVRIQLKCYAFFLQFLENFQTLRANYPFGRSWAIEGPFLIKSPHFRPNLSLGPIHVHPRVLCEN